MMGGDPNLSTQPESPRPFRHRLPKYKRRRYVIRACRLAIKSCKERFKGKRSTLKMLPNYMAPYIWDGSSRTHLIKPSELRDRREWTRSAKRLIMNSSLWFRSKHQLVGEEMPIWRREDLGVHLDLCSMTTGNTFQVENCEYLVVNFLIISKLVSWRSEFDHPGV